MVVALSLGCGGGENAAEVSRASQKTLLQRMRQIFVSRTIKRLHYKVRATVSGLAAEGAWHRYTLSCVPRHGLPAMDTRHRESYAPGRGT